MCADQPVVAQDVYDRVMSTLLNELDGVEQNSGVVFLGATSSPALLDAALTRPGRIDTMIQVDLPSQDDRRQLLAVYTRSMPLAGDVNLDQLSEDSITEGMTCAEVSTLCRKAGLIALRESLSASVVTSAHFSTALKTLSRSSAGESVAWSPFG